MIGLFASIADSAGGMVGLVAGLLGLAVLVGAIAAAFLRSTKNEMLSDLTARVAQLKEERDDERVESAAQSARERTEYAAEIARLTGQLEVLEGEFVTRIVTAVALAVAHNTPQTLSQRAVENELGTPHRSRKSDG